MTELEKRWKEGLEKMSNGKEYHLKSEEVKHIIRKLFNLPTHLTIKAEIKLAYEIIIKLGHDELKGDPETMFKEVKEGE